MTLRCWKQNLLVLLASTVLGSCIFAASTWLYFTRVFFELCEDVAYRDLVLSGLWRATFLGGGIAGLLVGCGMLRFRSERTIQIAIGVGSAIGLVGAAVGFSICCAMAATVPISRVSITWVFRPWWGLHSWLYALLGFLFVGALTFSAVLAHFRLREPAS